MKFKDCEQTWICQLGKPKNLETLKAFVAEHNKSGESLASYYMFIVSALFNTPAFGISGVNKFLNELTDQVRAKLNHSKSGKTSSCAHAAKVIRTIEEFADRQVKSRHGGNYKLHGLLTPKELTDLCAIK